jgi:D-alanyl-D-alanine carboxypeptidase
MTMHLARYARNFVCLVSFILVAACATPKPSGAAPFAAIVQDARTGQVLYSENADTRLHPASLTKMMTLYIAFQEIERGAIGLDSMVTVSKNAAALPPSRLGLKAGQKIALRYLIRAAAIKSANDAAQAIGDHISGNQANFAARMTKTARALGMSNTTFKNANGLTAKGHLSTAHDMNLLGRRLFYDFPQYYNIFSRRSTDAGMATVRNTNSRFLDAYPGADGIKTGYTVPAGFNLTASAERGGVRIITTVFGGKSTAWRNAKMADLMDIGFRKAPAKATTQPLPAPSYQADVESALVASADGLPEVEGGVGKTIRLKMAVATSLRPMPRPNLAKVAATEVAVAAIEDTIAAALAEAVAEPPQPGTLAAQAMAIAEGAPDAVVELAAIAPPARSGALDGTIKAAETISGTDVTAPDTVMIAEAALETLDTQAESLAAPKATLQAQDIFTDTVDVVGADPDILTTETVQLAAVIAPTPAPKRNTPNFDSLAQQATEISSAEPVVIRLSTSNARHYGVHLGKFNTRSEAERLLLKTQLAESATLNEGLRKVVQNGGGYQANFMGLTQDQADLACRRLQARAVNCMTMGP